MKIKGYNITMKNVWAYIQGNTRKITDEIGPDIFKSPQHIQEQIIWREVIHNPICYKAGKCMLPTGNPCKCKVPDKFYSDKECEGGCYPAIMDKELWNKFKQVCARRKIDIYNDKFDWDVILADIKNMDPIYFSTLIGCPDDAVAYLGVCREGDILKHKFEVFNPDNTDMIINTVHPSCPCCTAVTPKNIEPNTYGNIECFINTTNMQLGRREIWLTVRYNEIKRINLKLEYDIVE